MKLLTLGNPKLGKGVPFGYLSAVLHLAPANSAGVGNVCPSASKGCIAACLNKAGRGGIGLGPNGSGTNKIQEARKRRTRYLMDDPDGFAVDLINDLRELARRAKALGLKAAFRPNGTSDLDWKVKVPQIQEVADALGITLYDYTKRPALVNDYVVGAHWHVTYSRSERDSDHRLNLALAEGVNVAVVFDHTLMLSDVRRIVAKRWPKAKTTVNGDEHDLRFLDPRGAIVALKAKGLAKKDTTGFVVRG